MNVLDRVISFVSPKAAYERMMYKNTLEMMNELNEHERGYDAGMDGRLNTNWRAVNASGETVNRTYRDVVRARSQDLERNSDILESILLAFERNVVGTGFKLQAKTPDEALNAQIETLFKKWSRPKYCDVTQQQSFVEICQMLIRRRRVDGAALVVKRYTENGGFIPFTLQAYEVEDLDATRLSSQGRIIDGIEYNEYNRPIAYYFKVYDMFGQWTGKSERIDAKHVNFMYRKKRPSQLREMSELATTLPRVRDMNQYMEAVSVKERVAALLAVMIKRFMPGQGAIGGRGAATGKDISYQGKTLTPGMIMELNPGDDVSVVTPPSQGASATDFVRLQQRLSGSAQGISYEVAARDMSQVNYSSARQGLLEDRSTYEMEQQFFKDHFLCDVYEEFLEAAVLAGLLRIPDFYKNREEYLKHDWIAPGMKWIDPKKEADANKVMLDNNLTTLEQIAASTGQDWREIIDQRAQEIAYAKSKGVILSVANQEPESEQEETDEESENGKGTDD